MLKSKDKDKHMLNKILTITCISLMVIFNLLSASEEVERAFTQVYKHGIWGRDEDGRGFSGVGSTFQATTEYIPFLEEFIRTHDIKSIVDLGCGDWMFSQYVDWGDAQYLGIDTVKEVIERNQSRYSSSNVNFMHADILDIEIPEADLILCKDVMIHLTNEDIALLLEKMQRCKHCLITNDIDASTLSGTNYPISRGGNFRTVDLTIPPFEMKGIKIFRYWSAGSLKQVFYTGMNSSSL